MIIQIFYNPSVSFPTKTNLHRQFTSLKRSNHPRHRSASPSPQPIRSHRSPLYKQNSQTPSNKQTNKHTFEYLAFPPFFLSLSLEFEKNGTKGSGEEAGGESTGGEEAEGGEEAPEGRRRRLLGRQEEEEDEAQRRDLQDVHLQGVEAGPP